MPHPGPVPPGACRTDVRRARAWNLEPGAPELEWRGLRPRSVQEVRGRRRGLVLALVLLGAGAAGAVDHGPLRRADPPSDPATLDRLQEELDRQLLTVRHGATPSEPEPPRIQDLASRLREGTAPASPPASPAFVEDWGSFTLWLTAERRVLGDAQELERGFTHPQALSLATLDWFRAVGRSGLGHLQLRNLTDHDPRFALDVVQGSGTELEIVATRSRFRDLPSAERSVRHRVRGQVTWVQALDLELPFALTLADLPLSVTHERQRFSGAGPLGFRDWAYALYEIAGEATVGPFQLAARFPVSHFTDNLDAINSNTHAGGQLRLSGTLGQNRASLGIQLHELTTGQRDDPELRLLVDLNTRNDRVYGIRGLHNRTRFSISRRRDEFALTGRVKNAYEASSRLFYDRFRFILLEMGAYTRQVNHRRLTRAGLVSVPGVIDPATRLALDFQTLETRPRVTESWLSASFRGIPGVEIRLRSDGAVLVDPPATNLVAEGAPTLYYDRKAGIGVDVVLNSGSPLLGGTFRSRVETRRNDQRDIDHVWTQASALLHVFAHPRISITAGLHFTGLDSTSEVVDLTLSSTTGLSAAVNYVFGSFGSLFADVWASTTSGPYAGFERTLDAGFEATREEGSDDSHRIVYTSSRLGSRTDLLESYKLDQITVTWSHRF